MDGVLYKSEAADMLCGSDDKLRCRNVGFEPILLLRAQSGMKCREVPVKETWHVIRSEVNKQALLNLIL